MSGVQTFLLLLLLVMLDLPTLIFGFLAVKCALYVIPSLKRRRFVRWILPCIVAVGLMAVGIGVSFTCNYNDEPWPTSPTLSARGAWR